MIAGHVFESKLIWIVFELLAICWISLPACDLRKHEFKLDIGGEIQEILFCKRLPFFPSCRHIWHVWQSLWKWFLACFESSFGFRIFEVNPLSNELFKKVEHVLVQIFQTPVFVDPHYSWQHAFNIISLIILMFDQGPQVNNHLGPFVTNPIVRVRRRQQFRLFPLQVWVNLIQEFDLLRL